MSGPITELLDFPPDHKGAWNMVYNTMRHEADQCPYIVVFFGPWGFEPEIGAHSLQEARGTGRAFGKERPETERFEVWRTGSDGVGPLESHGVSENG